MPLKPTKTNAKVLVELLDKEWDDVEALALAVMERSFEVYESRAKFTVVGQSARTDKLEGFKGMPANGVCLGMFATENQAESAATSLVYSNANPMEPYRVWVLPVFNGTPHQLHSERKRLREDAERGVTSTDRLAAMIRSQAPGSPPCDHVLGLADDLEFIHCARFKYHPGDHLLPTDAKREPCPGRVPIPGERHALAPCRHYAYHPGPCEAPLPEPPKEDE